MRLIQSLRPTRVAISLIIIAATTVAAFAQSGSRSDASSPPVAVGSASNRSLDGSASRGSQARVGLQGYCPVCLVDMRKWIKGDADWTVEFDGKKYYFPGTEQAEKFEQNPLKYVPVLGGGDIVLFARTGKRVDGKLTHGIVHKGRIHFFVSEENKQLFQASPESYENADLALGGECIVCRVDMNQRVPGKLEFTAIYNGLRYQFPGEEQQAAFLKSPTRYVKALPTPLGQNPTGSATRSSAPQQRAGASGTR